MRLMFDGHLDIAWNALGADRDQTAPLADLRHREGAALAARRGTATVSLPEMRKARVAVCLATVLARAKPWVRADQALTRMSLDWPCQSMAYAVGQSHLAYYRLLEAQNQIRIITDRAALERHWQDWLKLDSDETRIGLILMMEGADPIVTPDQLHAWYAQGLRCLSLAHFGLSHYAAGTPLSDPNMHAKDAPALQDASVQHREGDGPLTDMGRALLAEMEKLGVVLDLSHLSDTSFFEAIDRFAGPVCATHCNARALSSPVRQLTDEQLRLVIERDGVVGVVTYNGMIRWADGAAPPRQEISLSHLVDHIDHICQLAGDARHVGIGSDMDGGYGCEHCPREVDTIADLQKLAPLLADRGFTDTDVDAIFHNNWIGFWQRVLP